HADIYALSLHDALPILDQVGSLLVETDERGAVLAASNFEPFGLRLAGASQETNQFAGTPRDDSIELDHMGERFYAADLGMWTSRSEEHTSELQSRENLV